MKALIDAAGHPIALYSQTVSKPPAEAVTMPDTAWYKHITGTPQRWTGTSWEDAQQSLRVKRDAAATRIREDYKKADTQNVTDANGRMWSGGINSALRLDAATRLAALAGEQTVSLFDANNNEHVLAIGDAEVVVLTVGAAARDLFMRKQAKLAEVQVSNTPENVVW